MTTTKSTMTWVERIIRRFLDTPGGARALRSDDELLA